MQCTVIEVNTKNALVEYVDADNVPQRVWLPRPPRMSANTVGHSVEIEEPEQGMPYGDIQFQDITIRAADLARALHQSGIWQQEDIQRKPNLYVQTVVGLAGLSLTSILQRKETN